MTSPQEQVWSCNDLKSYILKMSYEQVNKYYVNICKCYERLFFKK